MKLTTSSAIYHSEIKRLLTSQFEHDWMPLWNYCEITAILIEGHSWTLLKKDSLEKPKLIYRKWKNPKSNNLGIFSLDNIRITEEELDISINTILKIRNLLKYELIVSKAENIIIDGVDDELTNFETEQKYKWKMDYEMNSNLKILIKKITDSKKT